MSTAVTFELTQPIKYAGDKGVEIECSHIELRAPTGRVSHICSELEGMLKHALIAAADKLGDGALDAAADKAASGGESQDKNPEAVLSVMQMTGVDMGKVTLLYRELFRQVAWMGGEKQITVPRLDDMAHRDMRLMIGVYTANFILI